MNWFAQNAKDGWATCSITQAGFVRVLSNPAIHPSAPSPAKALAVLQVSIKSNPHHEFWTDNPPLTAISSTLQDRMRGHKQVTDVYLLAIAIHRKGKLVTFDYRTQSLAPKGSDEYNSLQILHP
jgi:toxin-antitoxin system PIN domain toxin